MNINRRGLILGLGSTAIMAPAIVHAGNLMPVKVMEPFGGEIIHRPGWVTIGINQTVTYRWVGLPNGTSEILECTIRDVHGNVSHAIIDNKPLIVRSNVWQDRK